MGPQMIGMQLIGGVLMALAVLVGASIAISLAIMATGSRAQTGQTPPGGIRREPPWQPQPDTDDARELVLL
jgi:predicted permease